MARSKENCIEWLTGDKEMSLTLSQNRFINKMKKLAEKCPEEARILYENSDGSIFAKLSIRGLHL